LLNKDGVAELLEAISHRGYCIVGPVVRDGAIVLDHISSRKDFSPGWTDEQTPGHYRLMQTAGPAFFAYGVGPQSWKKYQHPAEIKLWSAERQNGTFRILNNDPPQERPYAFFGVRPCDLAAITTLDRVLARDQFHDPIYSSQRQESLIVVVQCTRSTPVCFCASLGTGPGAKHEFDLALTELVGEHDHLFVAHAGSKRGTELLSELQTVPATEQVLQCETEALDTAAREQVRRVEVEGLKECLCKAFDDPRWEAIAARCLTCANCTMACPTCFCTTVEDVNDLTLNHAERWRRWDSCFTLNFSYIHGGSVRASAMARYRQWMTHKFATWIDQFGTLGCVGCGRCITWCPVGIDVTEGIRALRERGSNGDA
jgi:sulfhydrogenase subunit beta (sulfur reductase)